MQLFEEGDYEVALDYEIKDERGLFTSYENYKMFFKFRIENGNNMVFVFENNADNSKGSELNDGALAENGFIIDTANSQYLTIRVERYELIDVSGGKKTNLVSNKPASSGDPYCEEGIYVVSFTNKNQPDETSYKIFYVGSDQYINVLANSNNVLTKDDLEGGIIITDAGEIIK